MVFPDGFGTTEADGGLGLKYRLSSISIVGGFVHVSYRTLSYSREQIQSHYIPIDNNTKLDSLLWTRSF